MNDDVTPITFKDLLSSYKIGVSNYCDIMCYNCIIVSFEQESLVVQHWIA
jgi:hypothetical protein